MGRCFYDLNVHIQTEIEIQQVQDWQVGTIEMRCTCWVSIDPLDKHDHNMTIKTQAEKRYLVADKWNYVTKSRTFFKHTILNLQGLFFNPKKSWLNLRKMNYVASLYHLLQYKTTHTVTQDSYRSPSCVIYLL